MIAAYASISVALVLVVVLGVWGAYRDVRLIRRTAMQVEISRIRAHALRTVGRIERSLEQYDTPELNRLRDEAWLPTYWQNVFTQSPQVVRERYAAIVDNSGRIVLHSDPMRNDRQLSNRWYDRVVSEAGSNVFETHSPVLDGEAPSYVLRVPIVVRGREVGAYLAGFDVRGFEQLVADNRSVILRGWGVIIIAILIIVLLAVVSLYYIASRSVRLREWISLGELRRANELSQLAAGLAHEIRNPLHAIRLNLHALGRALEGRAKLKPEDAATIAEQSNEEIERVDRLLKELLGFANPEVAKNEDVPVNDEIRATLGFLSQEMQRKEIDARFHPAPEPVAVRMDRHRLRQVLLNLLMNAHDAVEPGGQIEVSVARSAGRVEITVSDTGHGISEADRQRVFEPFFSKKESGSGLGLALVKRFVEEARGHISVEANTPQGTRFRLVFPRFNPSPKATR
jgi:signal transduction histidine kinase